MEEETKYTSPKNVTKTNDEITTGKENNNEIRNEQVVDNKNINEPPSLEPVKPVTDNTNINAMANETENRAELNETQLHVIHSGSWGATLGIFYLIGMRAWIWLLISICIYAISYFLLGLPSLILLIYLIIKGKDIAWKTRKWKSFEEFESVQKAWDLWGKIILGIQVVAIPVLLSITIFGALGNANVKAEIASGKGSLSAMPSAMMQCIDAGGTVQSPASGAQICQPSNSYTYPTLPNGWSYKTITNGFSANATLTAAYTGKGITADNEATCTMSGCSFGANIK